MSYQAEISRRSPTAVIVLVDQSGSMLQPFGVDAAKSKADFVADIVNRWLQNVILRCAKGDRVRDYFHIGIVGYGAQVRDGLGGLSEPRLHPISTIADSPLRVEDRVRKIDDGAGGIVETTVKFPVWVDAEAAGGTPMVGAMRVARELVREWLSTHRDGFPPAVINITDGQSTDGDPRQESFGLRSLASSDGDALLFNCHISASGSVPLLFPSPLDALPDDQARLLFEMSSELPSSMMQTAARKGFDLEDGARGFAYQADPASLISFLDIGTRDFESAPLLGSGE